MKKYPYFNTLDSINSSVDCQKSAHSETSHTEINRSWEESRTTIKKTLKKNRKEKKSQKSRANRECVQFDLRAAIIEQYPFVVFNLGSIKNTVHNRSCSDDTRKGILALPGKSC